MTRLDATRRSVLAGAALAALGGCLRLEHRPALRRIVLRLPAISRPVFWETVQKYAAQNRLTSNLLSQQPKTPRNFTFVLRGRGLDIVGRNDAYDPLQPDDYVISFHASSMFGADRGTIDRFADTFRATVLGDNSIRLISDDHAKT